MKYLITIIGHARTGTNYLCQLLEKGFDDINSNYELFNCKNCFINTQYLDAMTNIYKNKDLSKYSRNDPILFLENLIKISNEPIVSHKIFPEHISLDHVYQILNKSNYVIILKRKFIDVYISKKRAISMLKSHKDPWIKINTTNYKIEFLPTEYESQKKIYDQWYQKTLEYIKKNNIKYIILDYDCFHQLSITEQKYLLQSNIQKNLDISISCNHTIPTLSKQDKSNNYKTKIKNYEEFSTYFT